MVDDLEPEDGADRDSQHISDNASGPPEGIQKLSYVYEALGHPRRRYLCYALLEKNEWSLSELAKKIAAWEHDLSEDSVKEHQKHGVYVALYHVHVPKLVDEGVISFDDEAETISAAHHSEQVLTALERMGASLDSTPEAHARDELDEEKK